MAKKRSLKEDKLTAVITALEAARQSRVIVYITGDKKPDQLFNCQVAPDTLPYFKKILKSFGDVQKITLALYTNGGLLETPWPLVNLIRSHCNEFEVVVLDKALSAGTMIALGADTIVMTRYSNLSPVDPAANINDGSNKTKHFEIEDIIGYIDFLKEKVGLSEQTALCELTKELTKEINPTMLGSTNRTHSLVRRLAKNLLSLHQQPLPDRQAKEIVEHLTQKLFSHRHMINRKEAREIGFEGLIDAVDGKGEKIIEALLDAYVEQMSLNTDFNVAEILGKEAKKEIVVTRAVVHSVKMKFSFQSTYLLAKVPDPAGNIQMNVNIAATQWNKI